MDPAGPLYTTARTEDKLDPGDAKFVQAIHTCGGLLGISINVGHADYWPNGGNPVQPGCGLDITGN